MEGFSTDWSFSLSVETPAHLSLHHRLCQPRRSFPVPNKNPETQSCYKTIVKNMQCFLTVSAVAPWWGILSDLMSFTTHWLTRHNSSVTFTHRNVLFLCISPHLETDAPVTPHPWGSPRALWPLAWDFWKRFCQCSHRRIAWRPSRFLLLSLSHSVVKDK